LARSRKSLTEGEKHHAGNSLDGRGCFVGRSRNDAGRGAAG
jgi:hypothetical protein